MRSKFRLSFLKTENFRIPVMQLGRCFFIKFGIFIYTGEGRITLNLLSEVSQLAKEGASWGTKCTSNFHIYARAFWVQVHVHVCLKRVWYIIIWQNNNEKYVKCLHFRRAFSFCYFNIINSYITKVTISDCSFYDNLQLGI